MSCPAITNKGGKLSISRFPVACELTLTELALLDYAVVPGVGSIGDTGIEQDITSYSTVNAGISPQSKAAAVGKAWDVEMLESQSAARDVFETASAVGNKDTYATRIEWPDGAVEFSIVQVSSPTYVKGAPSGVRIVRYTMIPSFIPIVTNSLPVASNVVVSGAYATGETLTATYDYYSPLGLPESGSVYQWYADGVAIPGADGLTYVIGAEYEGQMISFGVEPGDGLSFGKEVRSAAGGPVPLLLSPPTGLDMTPPFSIYKTGPQQYTTDFDPDHYIVSSDVTYYLAPDGNDSNDGLTPEAPKKSIGALLDTLNASPPTVGATIYLAPGWYHNTDSIAGKSIDFPCNLICEGGKAILAYTQTISSWTKLDGYNNIYQASISAQSQSAIDTTLPVDEYGFIPRLGVIPSGSGWQSVLDATPGALVAGSVTLSVHTHDGRAPDSDVIVFGDGSSGFGWQQTTGQDLYLRGIEFWGGNLPAQINVPAPSVFQIVAVDCGFRYSRSTQNGLETVNGTAATSRTILVDSVAAYNSSDGFGYRGNQLAVEIGCKGVFNGWTHTDSSDNGSTAHGGVNSARVNGIYRYNADRNVHDVNATKNWLVGCTIGDPTNSETAPYDNANLLAGTLGTSVATRTWVTGCTSTGGAVSDVGAYGNAIIVYDTWLGFENRDTGDNGVIEPRDENNW